MSTKSQIHQPAKVVAQKFTAVQTEAGTAFTCLTITDEPGNELIVFLKDPIFARRIADRAIEAALFLEANAE